MSVPLIFHRSKNHQLNFEGCRCLICQRVHLCQNNQIIQMIYHDQQSQNYHPHHHKEVYLQLIDQFILWEKFSRKLRFSLPELCVFFEGFPVYWVTKNKDNSPTKLIRNISKMNMFEIQHFFLEGYLFHHPDVTNKKKSKNLFKEKARKQCIVAAKYQKNVTQLLTLDQIQNLFKSKFKYMKSNLMYLQTLVGAHHSQQILLKIDLQSIEENDKQIYQRAKQQAKIFVNETKITDTQFYSQKQQIQFQKHLKKNIKLYLTYISLKIIFISSKLKSTIIKQAVFKWCCVHGSQFLWDVRIQKQVSNAPYWQNSVMKALQIKLKKTMSMMELQPQKEEGEKEKFSVKAKQFSRWLEQSTSNQWNQMKVIRSRLQKLESQKKALLQSQRNSSYEIPNKTFRLRNLPRKSMNQSFNPQS